MALARLASRVCFSLLSSVIFVRRDSLDSNRPWPIHREIRLPLPPRMILFTFYTRKLLGYFRVPDGQVA